MNTLSLLSLPLSLPLSLLTLPLSLPPSLPFARRLRRDQFLSLQPRQPVCLRAERGTLWVTVDGELADIQLNAGESRQFGRRTRLLVGALGGDAVLTAVPVGHTPPAWHQRLWQWLAPVGQTDSARMRACQALPMPMPSPKPPKPPKPPQPSPTTL